MLSHKIPYVLCRFGGHSHSRCISASRVRSNLISSSKRKHVVTSPSFSTLRNHQQQQQQRRGVDGDDNDSKKGSSFSSYLNRMFPRHVVSDPVHNLFNRTHCAQKDEYPCAMIDLSQAKSLIRLEGPDTLSFLQGLLTNHVFEKFGPAKLPAHSVASMNAAILNSRGRMLFDVLLTSCNNNGKQSANTPTTATTTTSQQQLQANRTPDYQQIYLECDSRVVDNVVTHLKRCKIRSKVTITKCDASQTSILAVVGTRIEQHVLTSANQSTTEASHQLIQDLKSLKLNLDHKVIAVPDPRLPQVLGYRFYMFFNSKEEKKMWHENIQNHRSEISYISNPDIYHRIRMLCGVSEGSLEMPADESLPLDNNFDILHGIDWHKGCYVGQELTARSHFTGQVRKRVFPVYPKADNGSLVGQGEKLEYCADPNNDTTSTTTKAPSGRRERNAGKLVTHTSDGKLGLGLVRFESILPQDSQIVSRLSLNGQVLTLVKPFWMHAKDLYQQEDEVDEEEEDDYEIEFEDEYETETTTGKNQQ